ncbi:MAG: hypothetical protein ABSC22_01650 [Roseiarcus sp.]
MRVATLKYPMLIALLAAGSTALPMDRARAQAADPFAGLSGTWAGDGSVRLANGAVERLRCQATYAVAGGDTLDQSLRCSSDKDSFDFRIQLENNGGAILGNWNELTRRVEGGVSGHGAKGVIQAVVRGQAFYADVTVATHGAQQSVDIRAQGGDLVAASIVLRRER